MVVTAGELSKLAQLRDSGVLTPDEFAAPYALKTVPPVFTDVVGLVGCTQAEYRLDKGGRTGPADHQSAVAAPVLFVICGSCH